MSQAPAPPPSPPEPPDHTEPAQSNPPPPPHADQPPGAAGQPPFGAAVPAADQPLPVAAEPPPPPTAAPEPPKRRWGLVLGVTGGVIGAVVVAGTVGYLALSLLSEDLPAVGDCLTDAPAPDDMTVVDCASADAFWSVIGDDGTWTHGDFEAAPPGEVCADHPSTQQALWVSNTDAASAQTEGEVVCLAVIDPDSAASPPPG